MNTQLESYVERVSPESETVVAPSARPSPNAQRSRRRKVGLAGAITIAAVIAYVISIFLYSQSGQSDVTKSVPKVDEGVNISVDLVSIDAAKSQMVTRITLVPAGTYDDPATILGFEKPLRVTIWAQTNGSISRDIPKGQSIGAIETPVLIDGSPDGYPFDRYGYGLDDPIHPGEVIAEPFVSIEVLDADGKPTGTDVPIGMIGEPAGLQGWAEDWEFSVSRVTTGRPTLFADLTVKRGGGVLAFVLVVLALMIVLATLALTVAAAVVKRQRRIEATMASWFAALLFALVPLRVNLPGAPPIGAWIDVTVFFWVEVALMCSMGLFISAWLTYSKPPERD